MGQLVTFKIQYDCMCSFCVLMIAFSSRELVVRFFDRVLELEESLGSAQLLQQNLKLKDEKVSSLNQVIQEKEDKLDDLENRCSCYSCGSVVREDLHAHARVQIPPWALAGFCAWCP